MPKDEQRLVRVRITRPAMALPFTEGRAVVVEEGLPKDAECVAHEYNAQEDYFEFVFQSDKVEVVKEMTEVPQQDIRITEIDREDVEALDYVEFGPDRSPSFVYGEPCDWRDEPDGELLRRTSEISTTPANSTTNDIESGSKIRARPMSENIQELTIDVDWSGAIAANIAERITHILDEQPDGLIQTIDGDIEGMEISKTIQEPTKVLEAAREVLEEKGHDELEGFELVGVQEIDVKVEDRSTIRVTVVENHE